MCDRPSFASLTFHLLPVSHFVSMKKLAPGADPPPQTCDLLLKGLIFHTFNFFEYFAACGSLRSSSPELVARRVQVLMSDPTGSALSPHPFFQIHFFQKASLSPWHSTL